MNHLPTLTEKALKMLQNQNKICLISLTSGGSKLARKIRKLIPDSALIIPAKYALNDEDGYVKGSFTEQFEKAFRSYDCVVCIMATGIVVRKLSSLVEDKTVDPAVLVVDELGNHVISLLSGHVGRANEYARELAKLIGADPVITTATDTENVAAIDTLAQAINGWYPDFKANTKRYNGLLADHQPVGIYIDPDFSDFDINYNGMTIITYDDLVSKDEEYPTIIISDKSSFPKLKNNLQIVPQMNVLGIGCRKNVTFKIMQEAFEQFCENNDVLWKSISKLVSIDVKQHEAAIHYLAGVLGIEFEAYNAAELQDVSRHYPVSKFVEKTVGVGNVANSSAEHATGNKTVKQDKESFNEVTMALSRAQQERK